MVWTGDLHVVQALLDRLALEPHSQWRADNLEDSAWFGYTPEASKLDALIDELEALRFVTAKAAGAKRVGKPKPTPRPSQEKIKRQASKPRSLDDVGAFFAPSRA